MKQELTKAQVGIILAVVVVLIVGVGWFFMNRSDSSGGGSGDGWGANGARAPKSNVGGQSGPGIMVPPVGK